MGRAVLLAKAVAARTDGTWLFGVPVTFATRLPTRSPKKRETSEHHIWNTPHNEKAKLTYSYHVARPEQKHPRIAQCARYIGARFVRPILVAENDFRKEEQWKSHLLRHQCEGTFSILGDEVSVMEIESEASHRHGCANRFDGSCKGG